MIDKLNKALDFQGQALLLRAKRQEVLASNLANADTPNYKARDFDFSSALHAATASSNELTQANRLTASAGGHLVAKQSNSAVPVSYRAAVQPSIDGNTVDMDTEHALFADNAVRYEAAVRFLNGQIKTILSALQGD